MCIVTELLIFHLYTLFVAIPPRATSCKIYTNTTTSTRRRKIVNPTILYVCFRWCPVYTYSCVIHCFSTTSCLYCYSRSATTCCSTRFPICCDILLYCRYHSHLTEYHYHNKYVHWNHHVPFFFFVYLLALSTKFL